MTRYCSEQEIVSAVPRLTTVQLISFVTAEIVIPVQSPKGPVFREIDPVRIHLACDLCEQFDLEDDSLDMVLSLIDRLHGVRAELKAVLTAIEGEAPDVRNRLAEALFAARSAK